MREQRERRVQSVEHAMQLLEIMREQPHGMRLTDLSELSGLAKATTHALLMTLADLGYIERRRSLYLLGPRLGRLSTPPIEQSAGICAAFEPALQAFNELCGEDCFLSVPSGLTSYLILKGINQAGESFIPPADSQRDAIATSAAGKLFIAHDRQLHQRVRRRQVLNGAFERELGAIRDNGYALDLESSRRGLNCVALPLRVRGQVVAALSASGLPQRLGPAAMERIAKGTMRSLFDLLKL